MSIEFTKDTPLRVKVGYFADRKKWDIQPSTDKFTDNVAYTDKMVKRWNFIQETDTNNQAALTKAWGRRAMKGAPAVPYFVGDPTHIPIVVRPGEWVQFECDHPFIMSAGRDPNVFPDLDSPDSPFGWENGQESVGSAPCVVLTMAQKDIYQQRFFKCEAWLKTDDSTRIHIDPDTVGSTDGGV